MKFILLPALQHCIELLLAHLCDRAVRVPEAAAAQDSRGDMTAVSLM
jgi:hypothetical protein